VRDLEELSRAEAGQMDIHPQPCDTARCVQSAVDRLRPQFLEKEIDLKTELTDPLPQVRADYDRAGQVFTNLLGNALQHTPPGGQVSIRAAALDGFVQFSIRDSGVGLAAEDLERVFQRFFRADKSRSRKSGGSGIGLTIARHLIEAQGGRIWAESPGLGQGSAFYFTLPLA